MGDPQGHCTKEKWCKPLFRDHGGRIWPIRGVFAEGICDKMKAGRHTVHAREAALSTTVVIPWVHNKLYEERGNN